MLSATCHFGESFPISSYGRAGQGGPFLSLFAAGMATPLRELRVPSGDVAFVLAFWVVRISGTLIDVSWSTSLCSPFSLAFFAYFVGISAYREGT